MRQAFSNSSYYYPWHWTQQSGLLGRVEDRQSELQAYPSRSYSNLGSEHQACTCEQKGTHWPYNIALSALLPVRKNASFLT